MIDLQADIGTWAADTFPGQTDYSVIKHLREEEIEELYAAIKSGDQPQIADGLADVLILALCLCDRLGLDAEAIINQKMIINRDRDWELDPRRGYHRHTEES